MKIFLLSSGVLPVPPSGYGGLEAVLGDLAICLSHIGHEVYVVAPDESDIESMGDNIHLIPCGPCTPNAVEWEKQAIKKYGPILLSEEFKDAVIHDHTWSKPIYLLKRDNPRLNVMSTLHGMLPYQSPPPVDKPCMAGISQHHAKTISDGLHIETRYVYNGINLDNYVFNPLLPRLNRYLFLARMTPFKGAHVFVDLMRHMGLKGDLVGDDKMVEDQNFVAQLKQACIDYPDVIYHGGVNRNYAAHFFQTEKCYILPNTPGWLEPFGLTVIESMACGCPVITTRSGAIPELIEEGVTGYIANTIEDLPNLLKDGKIEAIKSEDCRKRAELFSRENMADGYLRLYDQVLNGGW